MENPSQVNEEGRGRGGSWRRRGGEVDEYGKDEKRNKTMKTAPSAFIEMPPGAHDAPCEDLVCCGRSISSLSRSCSVDTLHKKK